jgi:endonuclease/exonuclease/phosphatase (EEP) superfamily protein YafD
VEEAGVILTRLAGLAAPLLAKAVLALGTIVLALSAALSIQTWRIGELQEAADLAQAQAQFAAASAKAIVDVLNTERKAADDATQQAIADALAAQPAQVRTITRTVERIAREDPGFAAARRPAELAALRVQQLRDVDQANGHRLP